MIKQKIFIFISLTLLLIIVGFLIFVLTNNNINNGSSINNTRYLLWQVKFNLPIINEGKSEITKIKLPDKKIKLKYLLENEHIRLLLFEELPWQTLNRIIYDTVTINVIPLYECVEKIKHINATEQNLLDIGVPDNIRENCLMYLHENKTIDKIFEEIEPLFSNEKLSEIFNIAIKRLFI